jgi:hypothetical protein
MQNPKGINDIKLTPSFSRPAPFCVASTIKDPLSHNTSTPKSLSGADSSLHNFFRCLLRSKRRPFKVSAFQ